VASPDFPLFKKLDAADSGSIEDVTRRFPPYSDFNLVSLLSWNTNDTVEWSILHGNLAVRFDGYVSGKPPFYSLLGDNELDSAILDLLSLAGQTEVDTTLRLVPQTVVNGITDPGRFVIDEDIDNHDYVFRVAEVAECRGARFEPKRKRINRFLRSHGDNAQVLQLDLARAETQRDVLSVFSAWEHSRQLDQEHVGGEFDAVTKLLRGATEQDLFTIGVVVDGALRAFSICEVIGAFAVAHFEKADITYNGLFQFLKQQVAIALREQGCEFVNYEQDLGLPGIRREKSSWRPATYLKKYVVSQMSG
jgi:hypothetical protein